MRATSIRRRSLGWQFSKRHFLASTFCSCLKIFDHLLIDNCFCRQRVNPRCEILLASLLNGDEIVNRLLMFGNQLFGFSLKPGVILLHFEKFARDLFQIIAAQCLLVLFRLVFKLWNFDILLGLLVIEVIFAGLIVQVKVSSFRCSLVLYGLAFKLWIFTVSTGLVVVIRLGGLRYLLCFFGMVFKR